jgi:hypothetical protein
MAQTLKEATVGLKRFFSGYEHECYPKECWQIVCAKLDEIANTSTNTGMAATPKSCECVNSCVATIYVCKDCGGRVNKQ